MSRASRRARQRALAKRQERLKGRRRSAPALPRKATLTIILATIAVVLLGGGAVAYTSYRAGNQVLQTVDGQNITQRDLARREHVMTFLYGLKPPLDAETKKAFLDTMVDDRLIAAEAKTRGLTVTDQDLADLTAQYSDSLAVVYKTNLGITVARLRLGVTQADLTDYLRLQILAQKLYGAVTADVTVTEADIQALYQKRKETLDAQGLSLDQARETLTQEALTQKRGDTYTQYLKDLRSRATLAGPGLPG